MINEALRDEFVRSYPVATLSILEQASEHVAALQGVAVDALAGLLERANPDLQLALFNELSSADKVKLLELTSTRTSLQILNSMSEEEQQGFLESLPASAREPIRMLLSFPAEMAGHYMDKPIANFRASDTVATALAKLRQSNAQRTRSIYVVDENKVLLGRVDMQDMALSDADVKLQTLLVPVEGFAYITSPRDELVDIFTQNRVDSIPLLDQNHQYVGVVRYGSLFQAAEQELTGSFQKMVGASPDEMALSSPWFAVRKRLPWLHINLLTAFLAAAVVGLFESTIAQFTALAILLPVVAGQSGNAGSQALAVTMRGLALREINLLRWRDVLWKEIQVGMVDGVALAITCGLGVFVWSQSFGLALVIAIAMVTSMIAAGISGALVPMILLRLGQDPATASSIILTTVTDVSGFISFLGTATLLSFLL